MRRAAVLTVVIAALVFGAAPSVSATTPSKNFTSCAQLWKKFPTGLARSQEMADYATDATMRTPKVDPVAWRVNRRLDDDRDGLTCLRKAADPLPGLVAGEQKVFDAFVARALSSVAGYCQRWSSSDYREYLVGLLVDGPQFAVTYPHLTTVWAKQRAAAWIKAQCEAQGYSYAT